MEKLNVLVLGVGGNVSQGIITALRISEIPCKIIGACVSPDSLGLYMCDSAYISPYANDSNFVNWVAELCNKENVAMVFTGVEEVVYALELNRKLFESQTKAIFISSSVNCLTIGNNKHLTVEWLEKNGLNHPHYAASKNPQSIERVVEKCGFPLLAKPNMGKGSAGILILESEDDINKIPENYSIQQYLGNEKQEYTVACYVDKNGKQQEPIMFRRELKYGTTFYAEIITDESIKQECMKICELFKPKGPLNIQLRMHNGIPVCFELNVRFSGTTPIRARFGYNDVEAMIKEYIFNEEVGDCLKPMPKGRACRFFNEFYIDVNMHDELTNKKQIDQVDRFNNFRENQK